MLHQDGIYAEPVKFFPLAIHLAVLTIFIFGLSLLGGFNFWETMIFSIMGYIFLNLGYFIFKRTGIEIMDKFPFRQIRIISWNFLWKGKIAKLFGALREEEVCCPVCESESFEVFNDFRLMEMGNNPFPGHVSLQSMQRRCKGCGEIF